MHRKTTVGKTLAQWMRRRDIGENALSRATGVQQPTIHRILTGESKDPRLSNLRRLAQYFGREVKDLIEGHEMEINNNSRRKKSVSEELDIKGKLPLLAWSEISDYLRIISEMKRGGGGKRPMIDVLELGKGDAFCVRVEDDTMVTSEGQYSFPEGVILQIDPGLTARHRSFVIARINKASAPTFKQLILDGGHKYLKSLNPRYPIQQYTEESEIIGVVYNVIMEIPH